MQTPENIFVDYVLQRLRNEVLGTHPGVCVKCDINYL